MAWQAAALAKRHFCINTACDENRTLIHRFLKPGGILRSFASFSSNHPSNRLP
jgi:hypothetical protein